MPRRLLIATSAQALGNDERLMVISERVRRAGWRFMRLICSANRQDPESLGPAARQLDFDLVARHVPDQRSADRRASRDCVAISRLVVADQAMLTNGPRRKILDLNNSAYGSGFLPGRLLINDCRRSSNP